MTIRPREAIAIALLCVTSSIGAQPAGESVGLNGRVFAPDGMPVSGGTVLLVRSAINRSQAAIDRDGRFRIVPDQPGLHRVFIAAPGLAPHRFTIDVPPSRTATVPDITLSEATYFHARFVTADGEVVTSPVVQRQSLDANGLLLPANDQLPDQRGDDGSITLGPLPNGTTMLALDMPLFPQLRLRDVVVNGSDTLIEGGTIVIPPSASLDVDIVDAAGAAVPAHNVRLEDAVVPSPLSFAVVRTNEQGRASFERLAAGRYRVWTTSAGRCDIQPLTISRPVNVGGGVARVRIVVGGTATFRVMSALGPLRGRHVVAIPESPPSSAPIVPAAPDVSRYARRPPLPMSDRGCAGVTDADGRVTLQNFPPGSTRIEVGLFNSRFVRRVTVPTNGQENVVGVPDGLVPVHVSNAVTGMPVAGASVVWVGDGGRVEANTSATGDALLESVGTAGGTMTISERDYEAAEAAFDEPPATSQVALQPLMPSFLKVIVVNGEAVPLRNALVELSTMNPLDDDVLAVTDRLGITSFSNVAQGALRVTARADDFTSASVMVARDSRSDVVVTLSRRK
jgi:hypothetical protein